MKKLPHGELPVQFRNLTPDELLAEMPFAWQPTVRATIADKIYASPEAQESPDLFARTRAQESRYLMPPDIAEHATRVTSWAPPVVKQLTIERLGEDRTNEFEREILCIDPAAFPNAQRQVDGNFTTYTGKYPADAVASALGTQPDRLHDRMSDYRGGSIMMARLGDYLVDVDPNDYGSFVGLANPMKLTEAGKYLLDHTMSLVEYIED